MPLIYGILIGFIKDISLGGFIFKPLKGNYKSGKLKDFMPLVMASGMALNKRENIDEGVKKGQ